MYELENLAQIFTTSKEYFECYLNVCKSYKGYVTMVNAEEKDATEYKKVALVILLNIEKANTILHLNREDYPITYWGMLEDKAYNKCYSEGMWELQHIIYHERFKDRFLNCFGEPYRPEDINGVDIFYAIRDEMREVLGVQ